MFNFISRAWNGIAWAWTSARASPDLNTTAMAMPPHSPANVEVARIPQQIHECPDDLYLNRHVRDIVCAAGAEKWRDLGVVLMGQNAVPDLEVIGIDNPSNVKRCCSKMFSLWRTRQPKASWGQLIEALKEIHLVRLASKLEGMLMLPVESRAEEQGNLNVQSTLQRQPLHQLETPRIQNCKENLKQYYLNKLNRKQSTRWPKLGDPSLYLDVSITRARFSVGRKMEQFYEEHSMGLIQYGEGISYVTISEILNGGYKKVVLLEGDPGCGKTTLTIQICKEWADNKLLMNDILIWVPLRYYKSVLSTNELFSKLGCPEVMEYAQRNNGDGLVFIFDGWDELPSDLQVSSFFRDIVFGEDRTFIHSTIVVTSRPSCSNEIAEFVNENQMYYQILGFSPHNSKLYIEKYFSDDLQSAKLLLDYLEGREYLHRHFYMPITMAIMCYVYCHNDGEIPETLSKLYENFTLLYIRSNTPDMCKNKFTTLSNVPKEIKPMFVKLCELAFNMLRDKRLVFGEEELGLSDTISKTLSIDKEQFDAFGLLHVECFFDVLATRGKSYSFIHRAIQELLAAIFLLKTGNVSDVVDEYFHDGSYLMNMFPFLFGLAPKGVLRSLAGKLARIYINCRLTLFNLILFCLFEAQDETLCREFGQVFNESRHVNLKLYSILESHYAFYFLSVCGGKKLSVGISDDVYPGESNKILHKYMCNTSTDIASFSYSRYIAPSYEEMELLAKVLSYQHELVSLCIDCGGPRERCDTPGIALLCGIICKHIPKITHLTLPDTVLSEDDLNGVGCVIATSEHLENLNLIVCEPGKEVHVDSFLTFHEALCKSISLEKLTLSCNSLSWSESIGDAISWNTSLKEFQVEVEEADYLVPVLVGLSFNTTITAFHGWPYGNKGSDTLEKCFEKCLLNCSLEIVDFCCNSVYSVWLPYSCSIRWSSTQLWYICSGLCTNSTLVTLDISGCCIDSEACGAVCTVLSVNTTLQHLFLNPCCMNKLEAIAMIDSCRGNDVVVVMSLVFLYSSLSSSTDDDQHKERLQMSCDQDIARILQQVQTLRQEKDKPLLNIYWKHDEYEKAKESVTPNGWR